MAGMILTYCISDWVYQRIVIWDPVYLLGLYLPTTKPHLLWQDILPAYKDEKAMLVKGLHEPIITEDLFYEVQDILDGLRRKTVSRYTAKEELPLRGLLQCPRCGRNLTGSAAKGNAGIYFYYHCQLGCKERVKAEEANDRIVKRLGALSRKKDISPCSKRSPGIPGRARATGGFFTHHQKTNPR